VTMKILCVSDIEDNIVYSPNICERYGSVDLVISAGDLHLHYYEYIVSCLNKPLYFVFGNHQLHELDMFKARRGPYEDIDHYGFDKKQLNWGVGGEFVDGKVMRDKPTGLLIAGLGGSMRYNHGEHQFTEFEMYQRIFCMVPSLCYNRLRYGRWLDILITHAPPFGIHDAPDLCHTGFKAFLWFMRTFKPRFLLHGHKHLIDLNEPRITQYHATEVINVYSSFVLERNLSI